MENENKNLNNKLISKDNQLKQELTDKEIMFIKLQNLEKENDLLETRVIFIQINNETLFSLFKLFVFNFIYFLYLCFIHHISLD